MLPVSCRLEIDPSYHLLGYYKDVKKKRKIPKAAEEAKTGGSAMARATHGRARVFKNKKREADRKACRRKIEE